MSRPATTAATSRSLGLRRWLLAGLALLLAAGPLHAADIGILLSDEAPLYRRIAEDIGARLQAARPDLVIDVHVRNGVLAQGRRLNIAVGTRAGARMMAAPGDTPLLVTLIPRVTFRELARQMDAQARQRTSALYIDQPPRRSLELLQALLPPPHRVGVLVGPQSRYLAPEIESAAAAVGTDVVIEAADPAGHLIDQLERLLDRTDSLLAVPDPELYNRETLKPILLTTFRYRQPLIGFSRAYVRAGALAAPYSAPAHLARDAAETALLLLEPGAPAIVRAPAYFDIALNRQVARSLGIRLPAIDGLRALLGATPEETP